MAQPQKPPPPPAQNSPGPIYTKRIPVSKITYGSSKILPAQVIKIPASQTLPVITLTNAAPLQIVTANAVQPNAEGLQCNLCKYKGISVFKGKSEN